MLINKFIRRQSPSGGRRFFVEPPMRRASGAEKAGALENINKLMLDALEEMLELDPVKTAATGCQMGNSRTQVWHDMTKRYAERVREAGSKAEITEAARDLARDVLDATGNEVTDENVNQVMYAATLVNSGMQPNQAIAAVGMTPGKNNPAVNDALRMLGGLQGELFTRGDDEWNRQIQYGIREEENKGRFKYSIDGKEKGVYNRTDNEQGGVTRNDRRTAERIRERAKRDSIPRSLRGSAALRLNRGDYSAIISPGKPGYELFKRTLEGTEVKSRKGDSIIVFHGSEHLFDRFVDGKYKNFEGAVGHCFTSSAQIAV